MAKKRGKFSLNGVGTKIKIEHPDQQTIFDRAEGISD